MRMFMRNRGRGVVMGGIGVVGGEEVGVSGYWLVFGVRLGGRMWFG